MVARLTCNPKVTNSSLASVTSVFFFWQGRLVHMPMNTAVYGCPYTRKGLTLRGVVPTGNAFSFLSIGFMDSLPKRCLDLMVLESLRTLSVPLQTRCGLLISRAAAQVHVTTTSFSVDSLSKNSEAPGEMLWPSPRTYFNAPSFSLSTPVCSRSNVV